MTASRPAGGDAFGGVFAGRSVFVTGHTGFKGSWLCLWLERLGARVAGYALDPPTEPSHFEVARVADGLAAHHIGDIRDAGRLDPAMRAAAPDVVLHLAAQSVVRESYRIPRETIEVNAVGTAAVLDAVRALDRPAAVVVVTSDKCYRNVEQVWGYREDDRLGDLSPYGGSKGAAELVARSYRHAFFHPDRLDEHGVHLATARAGNVVGGGDWTADALIVDVVRALAGNVPVVLRNPAAVRPWQHVAQCLSGYLALAARMLEGPDPGLCGAWNFGPSDVDQWSVRAVVERFFDEWGGGSWVADPAEDGPHEAGILRLAIDKALWGLDWSPRWSIDRTLRETARWYRRYGADPAVARAVSMEQIESYERAMAGEEEVEWTPSTA